MNEIAKELEAEQLFLKGAELERNDNYYDAIKFYRKALQLVPDIDIKVFRKSKLEHQPTFSSVREKLSHLDDSESEESETNDEYNGTEPLQDRFQRLTSKSTKIFIPRKPSNTLHLSDLPREMISYILRWVVSDELDLRSLDQCALICRGFYLCARDSQIWKSACLRIWKNDQLQLISYSSWRDMYLNHLRISTTGCYIGETKYHRLGERSFQDENYKPYHLVVYYRYLRFFADGTVLMINTPDAPNQVVNMLKNKHSRLGAVISGSYTMVDDFVHIVFKVKRLRKLNGKHDKPKYTNLIYNMTFQMKKFQRWKTQLIWKNYKLSSPDEMSYEEIFELRENRFPPFRYSPVKSYISEPERPLP